MKLEYLAVIVGVLIVAIAVITPGPVIGAGSTPMTFPGFIFGVLLMLVGAVITFVKRSRSQKRKND